MLHLCPSNSKPKRRPIRMSAEEQTPVQARAEVPELVNALPESQKINMAKFSDEQRHRIMEIASPVGVLDSAAVSGFGLEIQQKMNTFLDELLHGIRTDEVGHAGELTLELARKIKDMDLQKM